MKKVAFLSFIAITFLSGCWQPEVISKSSKEINLTIVHINPPKHVVIDMVDDQGNKYQHRSKHCNIHREYKVGNKYKFIMTETVYQMKKGPVKETTFSICSSYPVIPV